MDRIYRFGARTDGSATEVALLGGKGANLCEMASLGLPVPPGFVITTESCRRFRAEGGFDAELKAEVATALAEVEEQMGRRFGDHKSPLLLAVRSGAPVSMPGMMDTVLNLGLCPASVAGLAKQSGNRRFAAGTSIG